MSEKPSARAYNVRFYPNADLYKNLVSLNRKDSSRLVFGIPKRQSKVSLRNLYRKAEAQIRSGKGHSFSDDDQLVLPMMDFQITNSYAARLENKDPSKALGYTKLTLIMNTQYNVLEKTKTDKNISNKMIFNKPFVFYFHKVSSKKDKPLLLSWIANPSLLLEKSR